MDRQNVPVNSGTGSEEQRSNVGTCVHPGEGCVRVVALVLFLSLAMSGVVRAATVSPAGPEFQVNTYTTSAQGGPRLASDATGSFVAVWSSYNQDGDGVGIFGQRYDSAAMQVGGEFQISTYTTGDQRAGDVAMDAAGNFVVVWASSGQDGDETGVFGQRFDSTGTPVGAEFQINTYTTGRQESARVASDAAGNFVVVWVDGASSVDGQDGGERGIFGRRYDSTGMALGGEFQVNTTTTDSQYLANVAADTAGNFVVVWTDTSPAPFQERVLGQRYDSTGMALGAEFEVVDRGRAPSVAMDAGSGFVVVFNTAGNSISGRRYDSTGSPVGAAFPVSVWGELNGTHFGGQAAFGPGDEFVVVWYTFLQDGSTGEEPAPWGSFGRRFDASAAPLTGEFQVNTFTPGSQKVTGIAAGIDGTFLVGWTDDGFVEQDGSGSAGFARRFFGCDCAPCETCVPGGACMIAPRVGCRTPVDPRARAIIDIRNDPNRDKLSWKWVKGDVQPWVFGRPDITDDYTLCVYETVGGTPSLVVDAMAPAGGTCPGGGPAGTPCWKDIGDNGAKGRKYKDRDLTPDGVASIRLKASGRTGLRGKLSLKAKGDNLAVPTLGLGLPVTVQLQRDGECWEAKYFAAGTTRNEPDRFRATPGSPGGAFLELAQGTVD